MTTDLHIHSTASDGKFTVEEIVKEAKIRRISFLAISDHDSIRAQTKAKEVANKAGIRYITGVELNVTFSHPKYKEGKRFRWISWAINSTPTMKPSRTNLS